MQTLRIGSLMVAASLLGASPISAAPQASQPHKTSDPVRNRPARPLGMASWYGQQHQGRKMANGKKFDRQQMTAASWALPLGSMIRVVNLRNGSSVVVTVTDRGPAHRLHRVLDLSEAAAKQLGYIEQGLAPVFYSPATFFDPMPSTLNAALAEPAGDQVLAAASMAGRP